MVSVSNTTDLPPTPAIPSATILSNASNVLTSFPLAIGKRKRAVSYNPKTEACTRADVPPLVIDESSFPSILIGLPSRTLATTGMASPSIIYVVA